MNIDDLLRVILGGGAVVIQNLTINANTYTATNQVIGDNAVIDARSVTLPAPQRPRPLIAGGVDYRYSHCAPSDYDPNDPNNVWQQLQDYRLNHING